MLPDWENAPRVEIVKARSKLATENIFQVDKALHLRQHLVLFYIWRSGWSRYLKKIDKNEHMFSWRARVEASRRSLRKIVGHRWPADKTVVPVSDFRNSCREINETDLAQFKATIRSIGCRREQTGTDRA